MTMPEREREGEVGVLDGANQNGYEEREREKVGFKKGEREEDGDVVQQFFGMKY